MNVYHYHIRDVPTKLIVSVFFQYYIPIREYDVREAYYTLINLYPEKLIDKKIKKLVDENILDYGVSITQCWVRKKGFPYIDNNICLLFLLRKLNKNYVTYNQCLDSAKREWMVHHD